MRTEIRRNALYSALIAAAFSTALVTAAAIPSVPALAQNVVPAANGAEVSPMMQDLVRAFVEKSIHLAALDSLGETEMAAPVVQDRSKALVALVFHRPTNLMELAAKISAVTEYSEDTERWSIRILAEDAAKLAGEVVK